MANLATQVAQSILCQQNNSNHFEISCTHSWMTWNDCLMFYLTTDEPPPKKKSQLCSLLCKSSPPPLIKQHNANSSRLDRYRRIQVYIQYESSDI